ncbi:MAG: hypothetical protein IAE82_17835 [Opitutaceae bacterium]|nr:hypothetical protein [Opitutaceae bacterium]
MGSNVQRSDSTVVIPPLKFLRLAAGLACVAGAFAPVQGQVIPRIQPKFIYFPPIPPPLEIPVQPESEDPEMSLAPEALRTYVSEPFYAPLSTFISPMVVGFQGGEELTEKETEELRRYRRVREELLEELRQKVTDLEHASIARRLLEFEALAKKQTPRIAELERAAEALRAVIAKKSDWSELREWRLNSNYESAPRAARIIDLQVIRGAAYYADGLLPAQRRLLREVAIEIEEMIDDRRRAGTNKRATLFFQPETSRIPWPRGLPVGLDVKIEMLDELKTALKQELMTAVFKTDGDMLQGRTFRKLAEAQEERLALMERLADDVRREMALTPEYKRSTPPTPLPRAVLERIERFHEADREIGRRTGESLEDAASNGKPLPSRLDSLARADWVQQWTVRLQQRGRPVSDEDKAAMRAHIAELDAIHDQLQLVLGRDFKDVEGAKPDLFLDRLIREQRKAVAMYEYDIACLEPGLSPEQRRLLFSGAIERLELPLPRAEQQPTRPPGF